ncbi:MAG: hypothetical protein K2Q28_01965 [Hyphomicrobium sp.]|nr:hypothetical protein [Hyphomicrobium sp.]
MNAAVRRNKMDAVRRDAETCVDDAVKAAGFPFDERQRDVLRTLFANASDWTGVKPHGLKTREQQALWRGIAGDVARLIDRVEGPQGRRLGVETVLRLGVKVRATGYGTLGAPESFYAQYPKARPNPSLGSEKPDQEWWSSVRQLLTVLAEVARYEVEALERAKGSDHKVSTEILTILEDLYMWAAEDYERRKGTRPANRLPAFIRAVCKNLPAALTDGSPDGLAGRKRKTRHRVKLRKAV